MATVALQVVHSSKHTPLLPSSANFQPPPLEWSSSPLASNSSSGSTNSLQSSSSKSDSSAGSSIEDLPTPKDIISNAAAAYANLNRKRRVVWDLSHRSSCLSSPKHRYHPYDSHKKAGNANGFKSVAVASLDRSDGVTSSSSSPSRRTSARHRRNSSKSFKAPRSILKCLRNAKVSQYNLIHSSPGKRALHPSPGGRTFFAASPTASPRRRSSAYFANSRSPGRSPGRSPRVPSLSFGVGSKSPSLADITRLNGGGRKHTVAFPDLHAPKLTELGLASNGNMMMSMNNEDNGSSPGRGGQAQSSNQASSKLNGLLGPSSSNTSLAGQAANASSSQLGNGVGLGLGQPFEGNDSTKGEASSNDADPRMHIISACHTLKHSLASAVWQNPASNVETVEGVVEEDCFDSQPFDFQPRNIEQIFPEDAASPRNLPFPSVHLREVEAAYATIFQYAQVYIQAWYNVASPESASTSAATQPAPSSTSQEDDLDHEFAKLAPLIMKCVSRDVYRALHPVPVSNLETRSSVALAETHKDKASPTIEQTKEARQALLHRSGLSNGTVDEAITSSSPLAFPSNSPDPLATSAAKTIPEVPKRVGRSTTEMRRRRNEINVVEAALQAFGTLVSCERFWRYFDGKCNALERFGKEIDANARYIDIATTLQATLCEVSQLPTSTYFKGPKHRDLLSSFNWIIANQTLSTPAYLTTVNTAQPLKPILDTIVNAVMATIESSTKNGEKARRVLSESFRALRTLLFAYPSHVIGRLTSEDYIGKIAFFAKYLCSPTKALRDNAALLLSAIAFSITVNWDDRSPTSQTSKQKAQEMVSLELYRYWTLSPDQIEIAELSKHLLSALETKLPSDYHFVRLAVNTLPVILGRRFKKMERKGPHMWLDKAIELKKREDVPNAAPMHAAVFHLMTFFHVTYAWASSSKEVASKHLLVHEHLKRTAGGPPLQSDDQKLEEGFWGLGKKALRVIAQNVDAVVARPWTRDTYSDASNALEIDAAVALILSFVYAFTGLSYTAYRSVHATLNADQQENPSLHQDLSKVWSTFTGKYMPNLVTAGVPSLRIVGWQTMHALLRAGEEHPTEDAALRLWSMDRVINWRMLGTYSSQASQSLGSPALILAESVKPSELPSLEASWVFEHRQEITSMLEEGMKALAKDMIACEGVLVNSLELEDWVKNADGHSIMPSSISNCVRAFFNTLRAAVGQEDSHAEPTDSILEIVFEMSQFILCLVDAYLGMERKTDPASGPLNATGVAYSILPHLASLLEQNFGTACMQNAISSQTHPSAAKEIAQSALALPLPISSDQHACSAYLSLVDFVYKSQQATANLVVAAIQRIAECVKSSDPSGPSQFAVDLWSKSVKWVAHCLKTKPSTFSGSPVLQTLLEYGPSMFTDSKPAEPVSNAYATILSDISSGSPTDAWRTLQDLAKSANKDQEKPEVFLAWATLPLLQDLSLVEDESFLEQISQNAAIAGSAPHSAIWSLCDIAGSLSTGISRVSGGAAVRVISSLQNTLVALCGSVSLPRDVNMRLYEAIAQAFEVAYQHDSQRLDLHSFSELLTCGSSNDLQIFASLWNATYGNSSVSLDYSLILKTQLQAALDQGFQLQLPGWPVQVRANIRKRQHSTLLIMIYSCVQASPTQITEGSPAHLESNTEDLSESASIIEESHESEAIPETQANTAIEPALDLTPATVLTQSGAIGEESQEPSAIAEPQPIAPIEDALLGLTATQIPSMSQIPEIVDRTIVEDAEIVSEGLNLVQIVVDSSEAAEESYEETDTSIIPETQVFSPETRKQGEQQGDVDTSTTLDVPQEPTDTTDASLTDLIPETQVQIASIPEPSVPEGAESPELSEIEETQLQDQIILEPQATVTPVESLDLPEQRILEHIPDENSQSAEGSEKLCNTSVGAESVDVVDESVLHSQGLDQSVLSEVASLVSQASSITGSKRKGRFSSFANL